MSATGPLIRLYRAALRLYPAPFRAAFAEEMADVFAEAARRAAGRGPLGLMKLVAREAAGLASGIAWERTSRESLAFAIRSHGAPLAAGLASGGCFVLGAVLADGAHIFHPLLLALAAAVLAGGSLAAGSVWARRGSVPARLALTGAALIVVLAALPAARLVDHAWLGATARRGGEISWSLPGLEVEARPVAAAPGARVPWERILPEDRRGHIFSGSRPAGDGARLVMVWHRLPSAPPYGLLAILAGGALAVASHALRRRRLPAAAR